MTDSVGIFQHANRKEPNLEEGYTTCDNSRCLILSTALENSHQTKNLSNTYLSFLEKAFAIPLTDGLLEKLGKQ